MIIHDSNQSEINTSDLSECIDILVKKASFDNNISIDASEISANWLLFQKNLFLADLLGMNSFFIFGTIEPKLKNKVDENLENSIFKVFPKVIFREDERQKFIFPQRIKSVPKAIENSIQTKELRAIVNWEGVENLDPESIVRLKFGEQIVGGKVQQIQKVINQDFKGSIFGVNALKKGEIGTVKLELDSALARYYYEDNRSKDGYGAI